MDNEGDWSIRALLLPTTSSDPPPLGLENKKETNNRLKGPVQVKITF